jgi:hypothetical protein
MERVVCQGCPIAPCLYLFVVDVLGHMIFDPRYGIEGLTLPNDTMMFLKGNPNNL